MAESITIKALQDASLDAKSLEEVVNGNDTKQVTTRLGENYPSVKKAIKTMFENGGLPATPFATKALMTASALIDGKYAQVTDDTANNGLYVKTGGAWIKSEYDPATQGKGYTNSKVTELSDTIYEKLSRYLGFDEELLNVKIIDGETTSVGDLPTRKSAAYERTDYLPVKEGDVINFKGVTSYATPIKLFDADKVFLMDIRPVTVGRDYFDIDIKVDADTKFIIATSAAHPTETYTLHAPLEVTPKDASIRKLTDARIPISFTVYNGFIAELGNKERRALEYYQISEKVPVSVGDTYLITGSSNPERPIKGYDIYGNFVIDWPVNSSGTRAPFEYLLEIPEGIAYIVAASYYKLEPDSNYNQPSPLRIYLAGTNPEFTNNRIVELQSDLRNVHQKLNAIVQYFPELEDGALRSMSYNIYMGGRSDAGRELILKHINRVVPDILTVTEAGSIEILKPLLEDIGFRYFYGEGGSTELFFASKKPIVYTETVSTVDYARKPLYAEVQTYNGVIGVLSIHLNSSCAGRPTGPCHVEDYRNVEPWEPQAQKRTIQMYQIMDFLNRRKAGNPSLKGFIMQGDYNQAHDEKNLIEYTSPIGESYLPEGLSYPLPNAQFPDKQYEYYTGDMRIITNPSANGLDYTWWGSDKSPNPVSPNYIVRLDYISYSDDIELVDSEILNSESDSVMPNAGIRKYGEPLAESDSYTASDHAAVVADFIIR